MNEQEAIEVLSDFNKQVTAKADGAYQSTIGEMACKVAIKALEEIEQYRAIGTVVECREAVEKQKAKNPKLVTRADGIIKFYPCPGCSSTEKYEPVYPKQKYCVMCGQKLDWSEE